MKRGSPSFTLIEVMLAVAVFAFAAVGSAMALNEVIGIHVELLRTGMRRQAVESLAAQILAMTNNVQETGGGFILVSNDGDIDLSQKVIRVPEIKLPNSDPRLGTRPLSGWYQVEIRAETKEEDFLESISFLIWPQR